MKRAPLTVRQLFWTTFLMMFPTIILVLPGDLLRLGGRYAWWTPVTAAAPATALNWAVGSLAARRGSLADALYGAFGPLLGRVPLVAVWAALGAYTVVITREFAQVAFATYVFEDVPISVLTFLGLVVAGLAAWLGLTVIARGTEVIGPLMIWVYLLLLAAALPFSHLVWALPLLPRNGHFADLQPLARTWVWLAEPLAATLMLDDVDPSARRATGFVLAGATASAALLTTIGLWVMVADFGPRRAAEFVLPFLNLSKEITFGAFLQHFEVFLIPVALMGGAGKMAIFYWLWSRSGERLTGAGRSVWLVAGVIALGAISVVAFSSVIALDQALYGVLAKLALPVLAGCICAAYAASALRRGGEGA